MKSAIIVILMIALLLLIGIIGFATLWFSGGKTIFLPGLGIVISTPLLITTLIVVEVVVLVIAYTLWRLFS
jgi:hypothetical protein